MPIQTLQTQIFNFLFFSFNPEHIMNSGRKLNKNSLLTVTPSKQDQKLQHKSNPSDNKKQKLLDYRDYLISLRNIDLGSLIQKNSQRKKQNSCKLLKTNLQKNYPSISKPISPSREYKENLNIKIQKPYQQFPGQLNQNVQKPNNIIKKNQINENITGKRKSLEHQNPQLTHGFKNKMRQLIKGKHSQLPFNHGVEDKDLLCEESMEDLMSRAKMTIPKLIHIGGFQEQITRRSSSLKHSSRSREINMPSIEQRDPSQESEECQQLKQNKDTKFSCEFHERRKYNSCDQQKSSNLQLINQSFLLTQRTNEISQFSDLSQKKSNINDKKLLQEQKLSSTLDTNRYSSARSKKYSNHQNIETTPFNFKFDLKQKGEQNKIKQNKYCHEKQQKKMSLNVAEIVKRINSRQSKSSMSDRSSRSNLQKTRKASECQPDFFHGSSDPIRSAKISMEIHNSGITFGRSTVKMQQERKRLSLKMQVKQFREKNLSIMRLYE